MLKYFYFGFGRTEIHNFLMLGISSLIMFQNVEIRS